MINDKYESKPLNVYCISTALSINCYQCSGTSSSDPFQCNEWLDSDVDLQPQPCDEVYGAKYCVKHIGRFEGINQNTQKLNQFVY